MKNWLKKSACFSKNDRYLRTLARLEEFWIFILARVRETHVREVTSTMTLTTLISLVPMIAVSLSAFALFLSLIHI